MASRTRVPLEGGPHTLAGGKAALGDLIRRTLARDGLSARRTAELAGVTLDTVRRALEGRSSLDAQVRILAALGVSSSVVLLASSAPKK